MPAASPAHRAALLEHPLLREGLLWQAGSLGRSQSSTLGSGFAALDAELPGGGWPCQSLCEILQPPGQHAEWRLLAPALRQLFDTAPGGAARPAPPVLLIAPPFVPHGPGLADLGLEAAHWVWIQPDPQAPGPTERRRPSGKHGPQRAWAGPARATAVSSPVSSPAPHPAPHPAHHPSTPPATRNTPQQALHQALWVTEQAIKSQAAGAVLAWLDGARPEQIRRLQAAALNSPAPIFLMRPDSVAQQSSAAPLRVRLSQPAASRGLAPGLLEVLLIKRRGPAMVQPLQLHSLPPRLEHSLPARLRQGVAPPLAPMVAPGVSAAPAGQAASAPASGVIGSTVVTGSTVATATATTSASATAETSTAAAAAAIAPHEATSPFTRTDAASAVTPLEGASPLTSSGW